MLLTLGWLAPRAASSVYIARPWASPWACNLVESHITPDTAALREDFLHSPGVCRASLQFPGSQASVLCGRFLGAGVGAEGEVDWTLAVPWKKSGRCPWKTFTPGPCRVHSKPPIRSHERAPLSKGVR